MIWQSNSEKETFAVAEEIARQASPGDIYLLEGDLGVGKTVFAKGFAHGLGITEPVTSPTFTIVQEYHEGRLPLYHFDVYRIADVEEMYELDCEGYFYGDGACPASGKEKRTFTVSLYRTLQVHLARGYFENWF